MFLEFQFGNTCYCNSVLQALYFCRPFRERVLQYKQQQKNAKKETLLTCLADLFYNIATQKKKVGTIAPKKFIQRLRKENGMFVLFTNKIVSDSSRFRGRDSLVGLSSASYYADDPGLKPGWGLIWVTQIIEKENTNCKSDFHYQQSFMH